jgi:hypothetical protein
MALLRHCIEKWMRCGTFLKSNSGRKLIEAYGGRVELIPLTSGYESIPFLVEIRSRLLCDAYAA